MPRRATAFLPSRLTVQTFFRSRITWPSDCFVCFEISKFRSSFNQVSSILIYSNFFFVKLWNWASTGANSKLEYLIKSQSSNNIVTKDNKNDSIKFGAQWENNKKKFILFRFLPLTGTRTWWIINLECFSTIWEGAGGKDLLRWLVFLSDSDYGTSCNVCDESLVALWGLVWLCDPALHKFSLSGKKELSIQV